MKADAQRHRQQHEHQADKEHRRQLERPGQAQGDERKQDDLAEEREVGNFTLDGKVYEQNEIEFLPCPLDTAADQLLLAKWVIRNLACRYGLDVSFAPKITTGKAGSGMHIHMRLMSGGRNVTLGADNKLSEEARRAIAGLMTYAPSITAFGNKNPTSYFRLVPQSGSSHQRVLGECRAAQDPQAASHLLHGKCRPSGERTLRL